MEPKHDGTGKRFFFSTMGIFYGVQSLVLEGKICFMPKKTHGFPIGLPQLLNELDRLVISCKVETFTINQYPSPEQTSKAVENRQACPKRKADLFSTSSIFRGEMFVS